MSHHHVANILSNTILHHLHPILPMQNFICLTRFYHQLTGACGAFQNTTMCTLPLFCVKPFHACPYPQIPYQHMHLPICGVHKAPYHANDLPGTDYSPLIMVSYVSMLSVLSTNANRNQTCQQEAAWRTEKNVMHTIEFMELPTAQETGREKNPLLVGWEIYDFDDIIELFTGKSGIHPNFPNPQMHIA